jgi:hypothetical protein
VPCVRWRRPQRSFDYRGNLIVVDGARAASAGLFKQAISDPSKIGAPFANGVFMEAELAATDLLGKPSAHRN